MARSPRIPKYRRHSSGQARVTLNGRDHLLGPYGSAASRQAYERLIAEWLASPVRQPLKVVPEERLTINKLILLYWRHASDYYGFDGRRGRGDFYCLRDALKLVRSLYGRTPADEFGPLALKACRQRMVEKDWSRKYVNVQIDRVRRMFRWAAEEELVPGRVYQDLRAVAGLRRGRTEARESKKVRPVPQEHIDAAMPFLPQTIRDMVRLQLLAGCRPDELCRLRPMDLDRADPKCWIYRPGSDQDHGVHKTAHHDLDRVILLGPKAQRVLRDYLNVEPASYCFCPATSERRRNAERRANRKSRMTPSQKARRPNPRRQREPSDRYDTHSYRRAIARACRSADAAARSKAREANPKLTDDRVFVPTWSPNRLRHNRATELRPYGIDVAQTILGHTRPEMTLVYAARDLATAKKIVAKTG
jgi:integrase